MPIKQLSNLMKRLATLPAVPHQRFLAFGVTGSRSSGHLATLLLLAQSSGCCIDRLNPPMRLGFSVILISFSLAIFAGHVLAADIPPKDGATAKWMIEKERGWANMACGGEWVATEILADDFQGTAPKGVRYGKPKSAPAYDPKTQWSTDCHLDEADVRFFSADAAVVYGAESKTVALPDGKHERRCLVWSDMWLRRKGRWQIIAVQDNRVDCPVK